MANYPLLKQTNSSQDLSIEKRPKMSRFLSELVFSPAPIQPNATELGMFTSWNVVKAQYGK